MLSDKTHKFFVGVSFHKEIKKNPIIMETKFYYSLHDRKKRIRNLRWSLFVSWCGLAFLGVLFVGTFAATISLFSITFLILLCALILLAIFTIINTQLDLDRERKYLYDGFLDHYLCLIEKISRKTPEMIYKGYGELLRKYDSILGIRNTMNEFTILKRLHSFCGSKQTTSWNLKEIAEARYMLTVK